jgi:hypothetical protein
MYDYQRSISLLRAAHSQRPFVTVLPQPICYQYYHHTVAYRMAVRRTTVGSTMKKTVKYSTDGQTRKLTPVRPSVILGYAYST